MASRHIVGSVEEIPPGARKIVEIEGRSIGVFNVNGEFYAVRNTCPHQGGRLCEGALTGLREATVPGEYSYTRKGEILRCPWHGWEFDIKTGQSWWNPAQVRTRPYKVTVEALPAVNPAANPEVSASSATGSATGAQPGPYTAETYPVSVEQHYVVIEVP